MNQTLIEHCS